MTYGGWHLFAGSQEKLKLLRMQQSSSKVYKGHYV
jgi:hypothetical protein